MGHSITTMPIKAEILKLCTVAEMKENLRISYTKEDELIERSILAAYDWLAGEQGWLNRSILPTTWTMTLPAVATVELPMAAPAISLTSFTYLVGGVATPVPPASYVLSKAGTLSYARLSLANGATWPTDADVHPEGVEIVYVAGMAADADAVRAKYFGLHKAMALLAGDYFRNREDTFTDIRMVEIDRKVVNGVNRVGGRYRFMNNQV